MNLCAKSFKCPFFLLTQFIIIKTYSLFINHGKSNGKGLKTTMEKKVQQAKFYNNGHQMKFFFISVKKDCIKSIFMEM